ncbi:hypothetical protein ACA910_021963 [Epithemia clementina (nom. ined.)]
MIYLVRSASLGRFCMFLLAFLRLCCGFQPSQIAHHPNENFHTTCFTGRYTTKGGLLVAELNKRSLPDDNDKTNDDIDAAASADKSPSTAPGIDIEFDTRLYRVRLSRAVGIEWGTDLSFSFVYVRALDPTGDAAMSKQVEVGDQLCELRPVSDDGDADGTGPVNLVGAPFDYVMETFAMLGKTVRQVDLVFFRGSKDELKAAAAGTKKSQGSETVTVMVYENKGTAQEIIHRLVAPAGVNIRQLCVDNGINVYQSVTRWTNCKGKQLCGTCIVNVPAGGINTNRKSMDEASTLRENPDSYRLSCVTFAYGDCTVETFPPINAAQWTR